MQQILKVVVPGEAVPQGSMRAFVPQGWTRPVLTSDNARMKPWRAVVAAAAQDAQAVQGTWPAVSTAAIRLDVQCYFLRPASVSAKRRPSHVVKPDLSKLVRAIEDALTGVLWRDDAQIVTCAASKAYAAPGEPAHCVLVIHEIV